jgi:hypothetical protein
MLPSTREPHRSSIPYPPSAIRAKLSPHLDPWLAPYPAQTEPNQQRHSPQPKNQSRQNRRLEAGPLAGTLHNCHAEDSPLASRKPHGRASLLARSERAAFSFPNALPRRARSLIEMPPAPSKSTIWLIKTPSKVSFRAPIETPAESPRAPAGSADRLAQIVISFTRLLPRFPAR